MGFRSIKIHTYLRFAADNFGDKKVGYFAESFSGKPDDLLKRLEGYIDEGNILAQEQYLQYCRRNGKKPPQKILDSRNQIWGQMAKLQQNHDHEARHALQQEFDSKFAKVKDFFLGPDYALPTEYPFPCTEKGFYPRRKILDKYFPELMRTGHCIIGSKQFYDYARVLMEQNHPPVYFMYAVLYSKYLKDKEYPDQDSKWFYQKAKSMGYPPAVNLERDWDDYTIMLAKQVGINTAQKEYRTREAKRALEIFIKSVNDGKGLGCLAKVHKGDYELPEQISMKQLLHSAAKNALELVGMDGYKFYHADDKVGYLEYGIYDDRSERNKILKELEILASYDEPVAYYLIGASYGRLAMKSGVSTSRDFVIRACKGFHEAKKRRKYSYLFDGPVPDEFFTNGNLTFSKVLYEYTRIESILDEWDKLH